MIIIKIWLHILANIQKLFLKVIYGEVIHIGKNVTWRNNFSVMIGKKGHIEIGNNCFFNNGCSLNANNHISIGEGTLFGENVKVYDHNHRFSNFDVPIKEQGFSIGKVIVGKHCWIGSNAVLLKGTEIGDNCVIGAGVIVNGKVLDGTIIKIVNSNTYESIAIRGNDKCLKIIRIH